MRSEEWEEWSVESGVEDGAAARNRPYNTPRGSDKHSSFLTPHSTFSKRGSDKLSFLISHSSFLIF